jgi:tRNA dimethylallyltransferase
MIKKAAPKTTRLFYYLCSIMQEYELITIIGPTASGKTTLATHLAARLNTEIISGDSRQIYRGMDIGTGKDLSDYIVEDKTIPYYLIDICDPGYKYNVFEYQHDFHKAFETIKQKGKTPVLCGGTGMYIEAVLKGYKLLDVPENKELRNSLKGKSLIELTQILADYKTLHNKTDVDSAQRAIRAIEIEAYYKQTSPGQNEYNPINSLIVGIDIERELRRSKISKRLQDRLDEGMIEEIKKILNTGIAAEDLLYYGLEYKYVTLYVTKKISYDNMVRELEIAIHQFAKRQMTWFRGMERRGFTIHWINAGLPLEEKIDRILTLLNQQQNDND